MDTPDSPTSPDARYDGTETGRLTEPTDGLDARDAANLNEALLHLIAEFGPLTVASTAAARLDAELLQELIADLVGDHDKCELYADAAGEVRWRLVDGGNHQVLAGPQEGYTNPSHAARMARRVTGRRPVAVDFVWHP